MSDEQKDTSKKEPEKEKEQVPPGTSWPDPKPPINSEDKERQKPTW